VDGVAVLEFVIRPMTATVACAVATWRYPGEYSFYDADADPDDLAELLDPAEWGRCYFAADDLADHTLSGFLMVKLTGPVAEIGLGLRPDLTGRRLVSISCAPADVSPRRRSGHRAGAATQSEPAAAHA
jgi:hypothetical protein